MASTTDHPEHLIDSVPTLRDLWAASKSSPSPFELWAADGKPGDSSDTPVEARIIVAEWANRLPLEKYNRLAAKARYAYADRMIAASKEFRSKELR